jgi:hypothetical protein
LHGTEQSLPFQTSVLFSQQPPVLPSFFQYVTEEHLLQTPG